MTAIAVTSRVVVDPVHGTRSDSVDQRWWPFLVDCGVSPIPMPNNEDAAIRLMQELPVRGILLTGGNDLVELGGDAPERDRTESALLDHALRSGLPVLGVCRGMQLLLRRFGVPLARVAGQVATSQRVVVGNRERVVNSYHNWAATEAVPPLMAWAIGPGDVVKAVRHETWPVVGIMWHPERLPFQQASEDRSLVRAHFGVER
jgi:gamma-glutamyl-gamma-aminobutyrate hydrolase PuuD